ncbi:MAG: trypsin-like serine protease [Anaerolineae bacterium]
MTKELVNQIKRVKGAHVYDLLSRHNVVGVGIGYKVSRGVSTGELSLVCSVARKVDLSVLAAEDLVPRTLDGVKTDVVETGVLRAFQPGPRDRWRPVVPPGVSVGHYRITAGTFGCLVRRGEERFILSNNHVLADVNNGQQGDAILQPGPADGGMAEDRIATLADYVPLDFGTAPPDCPIAEWSAKLLNYVAGAFGSSHQLQAVKQTAGDNRVDAALARLLSPELVNNEILYIGAPTGVGAATLGTEVQKTGRTSGHTQGTITQIDATVRIDYHGSTALFTGQLVAGPMSQPGDSGSAVLDMDKQVVGLLFAGSDAATIINPIDEVLSALNVELAL